MKRRLKVHKVLILMGLTCSGKTKLDKILSIQLKIPFFDGNNFHSQDNINKMKKGYP